MKKTVFIKTTLLFLAVMSPIISCAQNDSKSILPQFRVKTQDTTTTLIRVINYFDRSVYQKMYFNTYKDSTNYISTLTTDSNGYASASVRENERTDLYVEEHLKIPNILIQKNKVNTVEIMDSKGFLHLRFRNERMHNKVCKAWVIKRGSTDTLHLTIPTLVKLDMALYDIYTDDYIQSKYSFYIKPSHIYTYYTNESFKLILENSSDFQEINLTYYNRRKKDYLSCTAYDVMNREGIFLPSNTTYKIDYRKSGRKHIKTRYLKARKGEPIYKIRLE